MSFFPDGKRRAHEGPEREREREKKAERGEREMI